MYKSIGSPQYWPQTAIPKKKPQNHKSGTKQAVLLPSLGLGRNLETQMF